jgi:hypothetical protein
MATKTTTSKATAVAIAPTPEVVKTSGRNVDVPPKSAGVTTPGEKTAPTADAIRTRAYFIWQSSRDTEFANWMRAEQELSDI